MYLLLSEPGELELESSLNLEMDFRMVKKFYHALLFIPSARWYGPRARKLGSMSAAIVIDWPAPDP